MIFTWVVALLLVVQLLRFHRHALKFMSIAYGALALFLTFALEMSFSGGAANGATFRRWGALLLDRGEITILGWILICVIGGIVIALLVQATATAADVERSTRAEAGSVSTPTSPEPPRPSLNPTNAAQASVDPTSKELQRREDELQTQLVAHRIALAEIEEKELRSQLARKTGIAADIGDVGRIMWHWPDWTDEGWEAPDGMLVVRSSIASSPFLDRRILWSRVHAFTLEVRKALGLGDWDSWPEEVDDDNSSSSHRDIPLDRVELFVGEDHIKGNQKLVARLKVGISDGRKGVSIYTSDDSLDFLVPGPWMREIASLAASLRELERQGYAQGKSRSE